MKPVDSCLYVLPMKLILHLYMNLDFHLELTCDNHLSTFVPIDGHNVVYVDENVIANYLFIEVVVNV